ACCVAGWCTWRAGRSAAPPPPGPRPSPASSSGTASAATRAGSTATTPARHWSPAHRPDPDDPVAARDRRPDRRLLLLLGDADVEDTHVVAAVVVRQHRLQQPVQGAELLVRVPCHGLGEPLQAH